MGGPLDVGVILLDIEGTVCPVSFVKDVLFPYALSALPSTLSTEWNSPSFTPYRDAFPAAHRSSADALLAHVQDLMSRDLKISYLKSLQGYLWHRGYVSGALRCPLFADVARCMRAWHDAGIKIVIYSSGSVEAQKLLWQYTDCEPEGDLRALISGYFDTVNAGLKQEKQSYEKFVESMRGDGSDEGVDVDVEAGRWLFLSDNVKEVEAAKAAGMQSYVVVRQGNAELSTEDRDKHRLVESFEDIEVQGVTINPEKKRKAGDGKEGESETETATNKDNTDALSEPPLTRRKVEAAESEHDDGNDAAEEPTTTSTSTSPPTQRGSSPETADPTSAQ